MILEGFRIWVFRPDMDMTLFQMRIRIQLVPIEDPDENTGTRPDPNPQPCLQIKILGGPEVSANLYCNSRTSVLLRLRDYLRLLMGHRVHIYILTMSVASSSIFGYKRCRAGCWSEQLSLSSRCPCSLIINRYRLCQK